MPFVPVTPTTVSASLGLPKCRQANSASERRASGVRIQGTSMPAGAGVSATMAAAPRRTASAANPAPSARCPRMATNTTPGATARESWVIPVTARPARAASSTLARASGASVCAAATRAPSVIDRSSRSRGVVEAAAPRRRPVPRTRLGAGDCCTTTPEPSAVIERPTACVTRSASRRLMPRTSGMIGRVSTRVRVGMIDADRGVGASSARRSVGTTTGGRGLIEGVTPKCTIAASATRLKIGAATVPPKIRPFRRRIDHDEDGELGLARRQEADEARRRRRSRSNARSPPFRRFPSCRRPGTAAMPPSVAVPPGSTTLSMIAVSVGRGLRADRALQHARLNFFAAAIPNPGINQARFDQLATVGDDARGGHHLEGRDADFVSHGQRRERAGAHPTRARHPATFLARRNARPSVSPEAQALEVLRQQFRPDPLADLDRADVARLDQRRLERHHAVVMALGLPDRCGRKCDVTRGWYR